MRKIMAFLLLAVLLVTAIPIQAQAEEYENTHVNTGDQRADIIAVALTQVGYQEGKGTGVWNNDTKYSDWAGNPKTEWCGWFVSWCANQAGVPQSVLKKNGRASPSGFGLSTYYSSSQYTPRSGDLFFKKNFGHVGLVYYVEGDYFYTVEGNTSTSGWEGHSVMIRRRALNEFYFASPAYTSDSGSSGPAPHTHSYTTGYDSAHPHKQYKKCSCGDSYYTGETKTDPSCSTCNASSCSHTYGSWTSTGSNSHQRKCTKCGGETQTAEHRWIDGDITKEPSCKEAGAMSQSCEICGATRSKTLEKLDQHIFKDWILLDNETHVRECEYCQERETAPHEIMVDRNGKPILQGDANNHWYQCAECGQQTKIEEHKPAIDHDDRGHWQYCELCLKVQRRQEHVYSGDCDPDCDECGFTRETEHVFTNEVDSDKDGHWYVCSICKAPGEKQAHYYHMIRWDKETDAESCVTCGYMSGKVVSRQEPNKAAELMTKLGKTIIRQEVENKWYVITGVGVCVLSLAVVITAICLISKFSRKRRKK